MGQSDSSKNDVDQSDSNNNIDYNQLVSSDESDVINTVGTPVSQRNIITPINDDPAEVDKIQIHS